MHALIQKIIFKVALIAYLSPIFLFAQYEKSDSTEFVFSTITEIACTAVKEQSRTGTCWSFSTTSFIESELIRMGKGKHDLSEMYTVRHTYPLKAQNYVRLHGNTTLGEGSLAQDVLRVVRNHGLVPEEVYDGKFIKEDKHNHSELDAALKGFLDAVINNSSKKVSPAWSKAFNGILDAYLGTPPKEFKYQGKKYTPRSFANEMDINADDYIEFTSYTHHPFYKQFSLEVPDNWARNLAYNLTLDELIDVMNNALNNGYTIEWDGDVSEKSFKQKRGVAILPLKKWEHRNKAEKDSLCKTPEPEIKVTQEIRQQAFDNYTSKDDHLMHIVGISKDQNGSIYYITKNSWGTEQGPYDGFIHMSESYVRSKTLSILIHKDAIPETIAKKIKH